MTGLCAYALAFSTLLSSQGADAHRHKAFAWIGGNPPSLPASSRAVKRFRKTLTTTQPLCTSQPTLPLTVRCTDSGQQRGFPCWAPRTGAPAGAPIRARGQDETVGTHASYVKSGEPKPRVRRSAASVTEPGPPSREVSEPGTPGSGSASLRSAGDQLDAGHRAPAPAEHEKPAVQQVGRIRHG